MVPTGGRHLQCVHGIPIADDVGQIAVVAGHVVGRGWQEQRFDLERVEAGPVPDGCVPHRCHTDDVDALDERRLGRVPHGNEHRAEPRARRREN